MESVDVAIVGAGVTGLSTAWRLAERGREAIVLERFALGHDRGSSHGATRIFRYAYDDPLYVRMAQAALPLWRELESAAATELLHMTGGLDVGDAVYLEGLVESLEGCGASAERFDTAARARAFPWLEAGDDPAVFSPDTGVLAAADALAAMAATARTGGVEIRESTTCERIEPGDGAVRIHTDSGQISARRAVLAAGAWTGPLLKPLGLSIPVKVTREQVLYFNAAESVLPFIHRDGVVRYAVPPFAGTGAVKVAEHGTGEITSAAGRAFEMDFEGSARVAAYVEEALPGFDAEPSAFETCLYTTTPDEGFLIDTAGPLIIASPCSGHGFKFGPIVGETLAALATGRAPPVSMERFALSRFA